MSRLAGLIVMFIIVMAFCSSIRKKPAPATGDVCSIENEEGAIGIIKILFIDRDVVHIKVYADVFFSRPEFIDPAALVMEHSGEEGGLAGIPFMTVDKSQLISWKPEVMAFEPVSASEMKAGKGSNRM